MRLSLICRTHVLEFLRILEHSLYCSCTQDPKSLISLCRLINTCPERHSRSQRKWMLQTDRIHDFQNVFLCFYRVFVCKPTEPPVGKKWTTFVFINILRFYARNSARIKIKSKSYTQVKIKLNWLTENIITWLTTCILRPRNGSDDDKHDQHTRVHFSFFWMF